jgi:small subunit ribosomal protein S20
MAHTQSALKRARQSKKNRSKNNATASLIKTTRRKLDAALAKKDKGAAEKALAAFNSVLDKAAKYGVIDRNTATRRKTRAAAATRKALAA